MKLFHKYVVKQFLKYLLIVQLFVSLLALISSTMADTKMLANYDYSFLQLINVEVFSILLSMNSAIPLTTTVSAIIVILLMMRSNEILAYVTIGGTVKTLAVPFLSVGVCISAMMIVFEYKIIPEVREARELILAEIRHLPYEKRFGYVNLWTVDGKNKLINIEVADLINNVIINTKEYTLNEKFQVDKIKSIPIITKSGKDWIIEGGKEIDISVNPPVTTEFGKSTVKSSLFDDLMAITNKDPRTLSPKELVGLVKMMKNRGLKANYYELLLYGKYSKSLSVLVLLILTFPLAINFSRNYSLIKNAAITFTTGLVFWLTQAMCYSLGDTGMLDPFTANFLPAFIFIIISIILIYRRGRAH